MIGVDLDVTFPDWKTDTRGPTHASPEIYLAWLAQNRADLIRRGLLEKLRADVARQPVDARFVL